MLQSKLKNRLARQSDGMGNGVCVGRLRRPTHTGPISLVR